MIRKTYKKLRNRKKKLQQKNEANDAHFEIFYVQKSSC